MKPDWFKLCEDWQSSGRFGLTIPFVLGALRRSPKHLLGNVVGLEEVRALLVSLRDDAPHEVLMRLYMCERADDLVLARVGAPPQYCVAFPPPNHSEPALFVEKSVLLAGDPSFDGLVAYIWRRYESAILTETFSRQNGEFRAFTDVENEFIRRALARHADES